MGLVRMDWRRFIIFCASHSRSRSAGWSQTSSLQSEIFLVEVSHEVPYSFSICLRRHCKPAFPLATFLRSLKRMIKLLTCNLYTKLYQVSQSYTWMDIGNFLLGDWICIHLLSLNSWESIQLLNSQEAALFLYLDGVGWKSCRQELLFIF